MVQKQAYNPFRRQWRPITGPYEFKEINRGISVTNPTTQFWNVAHGPPITLAVIMEVQRNARSIESLTDLRR